MDLSELERQQLINQFLILEKLYPEDADYYAKHRKALQEGYKLHYKWIFEHLYEEMSEEECEEVLDILEMYQALAWSYMNITGKKEVDDESLASFVRRRFGNEALERIAQPMIGGVYTADPEKLSLRATMPQFLELEEKYGSVIKGMSYNEKENEGDIGARYSHFLSFKNGMKTLINTIQSKLPENSVSLGETVKGITPSDQGWNVLTQKRTTDASAIIITTPSYHAASLIHNFDPSLGSDLSSIEYASSAVIILAYKREDISHDLNGFGFVVPDIENSNLIACSFSSIKFEGRAPRGYVLLRAFVGGALNPGICDLEDTILIQEAEKEVSQILGISSAPEFTILKRYPEAMPQYHVGHLQFVEKIKEKLNRHQCLEIAGNAYSGVGIPDCVHSGEQAAEGILKELF